MTLLRESVRVNRIGILFTGVIPLAALHDISGDRKYLNPSERLAFYRAAQRINDHNKRAFCLTLFHTGCRISEALELPATKIDESDGCLIFRTLKQRQHTRYRAVPVPADHIELMQSCGLQGAKRMFGFGRTTGWKTVKACMAAAGLDGIKATPKGLRHGFAIVCVSQGVPLPTVQKWLGHARLETTSIYLDYVGDDERKLAERVWSMTS